MTIMQYPLHANGSWANAKLTAYRKHSQFFCDCVERHPVNLVKPSDVFGKRPFSDYFVHVSKKFKSSDAWHVCISMRRRGESVDHFNAKYILREMVGRYTFTNFRYTSCLHTEHMDTEGCEVSIESTITDGRWRYDCLLTRGRVDVAALEVVHSHRGGRTLEEELQELLRQDEVIVIHYNNMHERARILRIQRQENAPAVYYNNIHEHGIIMQILPVIDSCQGQVMFHLRHVVHIEIPGVGEVICHKAHKWTHGILVTDFSSESHMDTSKLCIVLFECAEGEIEKKYPLPNFHRKFHIFLN